MNAQDVSYVSYLRGFVKTNAIGLRESIVYEWVGKSPYVRISRSLLDEFENPGGLNRIAIGPYRLLLVEDEPWNDSCLYVRNDKLGILRFFLHKVTNVFDLVYRRFIITLAVWHLADYHASMIPSWRDIKIFKGKSRRGQV